MTLRECFILLEIQEGASLDEIKAAYRRRAFALHPDLHPDTPGAAQRFHKLNEAYVILRQEHLAAQAKTKRPTTTTAEQAKETAKTREEAQKAYAQAQKQHSATSQQNDTDTEPSQNEVLRTILDDDFARRVFEDIYRHIQQNKQKEQAEQAQTRAPHTTRAAKPVKKRVQHYNKKLLDNPFVNKVSAWLRRQIDEEQVISFPAAALVPGAKIRLQIQHGFSGEVQTIELTLPQNFTPDKPLRLKGMGKRLGSWSSDLYLRFEPT